MLGILIYLFIFSLIFFVVIKAIVKKKYPSNYYTPYDHITGQEEKNYHEERVDIVEEKEDSSRK